MKRFAQDFISTTKTIMTDQDAVEYKMRLLHPKLFGLFCPVKYQLIDKTKVYIPYEQMNFSYEIHRGNKSTDYPGKKGTFDKQGKISIIFDLNEVHPFHFDLFDQLELEKTDCSKLNGSVLPDRCSEKEALQKGMEAVTWQMLRRVFQTIPKIEILDRIKFYRPAWELLVVAKGKQFERYAYMDNYVTQNEHISGLKVRLDV